MLNHREHKQNTIKKYKKVYNSQKKYIFESKKTIKATSKLKRYWHI